MKTSGRPCPRCKGPSRVIDNDVLDDYTYRRRRCQDCGYRWSTRERDEETGGTPIHADDKPQP